MKRTTIGRFTMVLGIGVLGCGPNLDNLRTEIEAITTELVEVGHIYEQGHAELVEIMDAEGECRTGRVIITGPIFDHEEEKLTWREQLRERIKERSSAWRVCVDAMASNDDRRLEIQALTTWTTTDAAQTVRRRMVAAVDRIEQEASANPDNESAARAHEALEALGDEDRDTILHMLLEAAGGNQPPESLTADAAKAQVWTASTLEETRNAVNLTRTSQPRIDEADAAAYELAGRILGR